MNQKVLQHEFRLFGPHKGKTMKINGHPFVDGVFVKIGAEAQTIPLRNLFKFYGAYAVGTPEYTEALAKEAQVNGTSEVHEEAEQGSPDGVQRDSKSSGEGSAKESADVSKVDVDSEAGSTGSVSSGDGHEHSGIPKYEEAGNWPEPSEPKTVANQEIRIAVHKLDPQNKDHWVATGPHAGFPRLSAVEEAYGKAGVTRADVNAAAPNWDRTRAVEAALEG